MIRPFHPLLPCWKPSGYLLPHPLSNTPSIPHIVDFNEEPAVVVCAPSPASLSDTHHKMLLLFDLSPLYKQQWCNGPLNEKATCHWACFPYPVSDSQGYWRCNYFILCLSKPGHRIKVLSLACWCYFHQATAWALDSDLIEGENCFLLTGKQ